MTDPRMLVERNSFADAGAADHWLRARSIPQHAVSKYCVGVSLPYPVVRSNRKLRTLQRHFGWDDNAAYKSDTMFGSGHCVNVQAPADGDSAEKTRHSCSAPVPRSGS